jgi:hypothetical protein
MTWAESVGPGVAMPFTIIQAVGRKPPTLHGFLTIKQSGPAKKKSMQEHALQAALSEKT